MRRLATIALAALAFPAHAADLHLYTRLGVGLDLHPQRYAGLSQDRYGDWRYGPCKLFKSGPMDSVALGLRYGPAYAELEHISAIEDGLNGAGISLLVVGVGFDIWNSR